MDLDQQNIEILENNLGFHPLALEDSTHTIQAPKVEDYEEHLFIVVRAVKWEEHVSTQQLSIFLTKRIILTVHRKELKELEDVRERIRKKSPKLMKSGPDYLCFTILDAIVDAYSPVVDKIAEQMETIEDEIVNNPSKAIVDKLHSLRRNLLFLRKEISPQTAALEMLFKPELPLLKKETRNYIRDVYDHTARFVDSLDTYRELTADIFQIYLSSMQISLNEVMKLLTIIATVVLPLTLITGVYGMNFANIPELQHPFGYYFTLAFMSGLAATMIFYFKRKGWL